MRSIVVAAVLVSLAWPGPRVQAMRQPCLRYEPDTVALTGTLVERTFPGPPNFEDTLLGDQRSVGLYLLLREPVCAEGGAWEATMGRRAHVTLVQLVLAGDGQAGPLRKRLGRPVTLRGVLYPDHTGWHHAPLLLKVAAG